VKWWAREGQALAVWDGLMLDGPAALVRVALHVLAQLEGAIMRAQEPAQVQQVASEGAMLAAAGRPRGAQAPCSCVPP
jgi:hypothetical protein